MKTLINHHNHETNMILIYTTNPSTKVAERIVLHLLKKKLIVCGNIMPSTSIYTWEEDLRKEQEFIAILKTSDENWEAVRAEIESMHPYQTACILKIRVETDEAYNNWVTTSCAKK